MSFADLARIAARYRTAMALAMLRALAAAGFDSPDLRAALRDGRATGTPAPATDGGPTRAEVLECFRNRGPSPMDGRVR